MGEKAELERQFNDLTVLRAQSSDLQRLRVQHHLERNLLVNWRRLGGVDPVIGLSENAKHVNLTSPPN